MDPLSEVLGLLKPRSYVSGGFPLGASRAIRFGSYQGIKCYAVLAGQCWLSVEGIAEPVLLTMGDCFVLPRGIPFCLASDLSAQPEDFAVLLAAQQSGSAPVVQQQEDGCFIAGGHFYLAGGHAEMLLAILPPIVHLVKEADKAALRWSLERMRDELRDPQPGSGLVAQQLAYMLLVQALRLHLAGAGEGGVGWLFALADTQMRAAITCMHEEPARRWTLQELASCVGMSRSVFALRFKATVGVTPMEYLTRWRMMLAGDRLQHSNESLAALAASLGYESESAFGKAFRRVMGSSPRQYSRRREAAPGMTSRLAHEA